MTRQSPPLNETDAVDYPALTVFIPDSGDRQAIAAVLTDAATKANLPQHHVRSDAARGGFWISDNLADVVYDGADEEDTTPETPDEAPAKTGRTKK